ncbi:hypothetical protein BpHYR1_004755, partial [Brachionus plicatilis]
YLIIIISEPNSLIQGFDPDPIILSHSLTQKDIKEFLVLNSSSLSIHGKVKNKANDLKKLKKLLSWGE